VTDVDQVELADQGMDQGLPRALVAAGITLAIPVATALPAAAATSGSEEVIVICQWAVVRPVVAP
jgi:hypothetical protein